jgi:hypothetical protein
MMKEMITAGPAVGTGIFFMLAQHEEDTGADRGAYTEHDELEQRDRAPERPMGVATALGIGYQTVDRLLASKAFK